MTPQIYLMTLWRSLTLQITKPQDQITQLYIKQLKLILMMIMYCNIHHSATTLKPAADLMLWLIGVCLMGAVFLWNECFDF